MSESSVFSELRTTYTQLPLAWDELLTPDGVLRPEFAYALGALGHLSIEQYTQAQHRAETTLLNLGVTFSVFSDSRGTDKIFPFCLMPRLISAADWQRAERGLIQRMQALHAFLDDVYGDQRIFEENRVLKEFVLGAQHYVPQLRGVRPPGKIRIHVAGVDLIRDAQGNFVVLEDNLRIPSGVSYVIENRLLSKRFLPAALAQAHVHQVDSYSARLAEALHAVTPRNHHDTNVVVLTPGPYNSAYFEHSFLARTMGLELVQASDLFVDGDKLFVRTTRGPRQVDVVYRRTDEAFIDPEMFRSDSVLGIRGLMRVYMAGNVALANAPGNGVADDKGIYPFVPDMIRFYLQQDPILGQVPTYVCAKDDERAYVLEHLDELVVKTVDEAGGYGMLMGPDSTADEREVFRKQIESNPRKYIAQPRMELSVCPTWDKAQRKFVPCRVDLRPYIITSPKGSWVLPGGLTRVALRNGSYVVNSSQGGGSKDTWVLKGAP